jgi:MGT family glycosyltransferase
LTSETFDFVPPELPANVRYAGAMLDDPSWAGASWTPPWPAENRDPIVLVGLSSTFQNQLSALQRIAAALAEMPVRAVITLGPALAPDAISAPASNVAIVAHAPHAAVLRDAALAITHCGHGTTMRALAAGVPIVCMPMGRDQGDTAARVVHHGAGVRIKPTASSAAIRKAVATVLRDPRFTAGAKALAAAIARDGRELDPAALVEETGANSVIAAAS